MLAGSAEGQCDGFEIEVAMESDEDQEKISELIRLAHRMCFTEDALGGQKITRRHSLNGKPLTVDE